MDFRIGFGFDLHKLEEKADFSLGGINIPHDKGAIGHSDADVLIHAICDAILGSVNLGDIGMHFPDTSNAYKNIDSKLLLKEVINKLIAKDYKIHNIDSTICLENPKINPFISRMKQSLSECINISVDDISIKATTHEKKGVIGREEAVSAYAVVLVKKI